MNAYSILSLKGFSSKALLAFNVIVGKVGTTNKNEFLTDYKELFMTYSIYVFDNVIVLFAKNGCFCIHDECMSGSTFIIANYFIILKQVQASLVR